MIISAQAARVANGSLPLAYGDEAVSSSGRQHLTATQEGVYTDVSESGVKTPASGGMRTPSGPASGTNTRVPSATSRSEKAEKRPPAVAGAGGTIVERPPTAPGMNRAVGPFAERFGPDSPLRRPNSADSVSPTKAPRRTAWGNSNQPPTLGQMLGRSVSASSSRAPPPPGVGGAAGAAGPGVLSGPAGATQMQGHPPGMVRNNVYAPPHQGPANITMPLDPAMELFLSPREPSPRERLLQNRLAQRMATGGGGPGGQQGARRPKSAAAGTSTGGAGHVRLPGV